MNHGTNIREIPVKGMLNPTAVAVDWIGNNLYILEKEGKRVDLVSINGGHQRNILSYLVNPTDIAVDPNVG